MSAEQPQLQQQPQQEQMQTQAMQQQQQQAATPQAQQQPQAGAGGEPTPLPQQPQQAATPQQQPLPPGAAPHQQTAPPQQSTPQQQQQEQQPAPQPAGAGSGDGAQQQQQPGGDAAPATAPTPEEQESAEQRRQEDTLLQQAEAIRAEWQRRALGYGPRYEDPSRPLTHWDILLKEAYWMAKDVGQERLWKRRVAYHVGQAAAAEGRRRLQAAAAAKEAAAKTGGRGSKAAKKEEAEQHAAAAQSIAGILAMEQPELDLQVDFLHFWANNGEFTQCVIAHLENADVQRLLRIYQYSRKYEADWELAWLQAEQREAELRKLEPLPMDDDAAKRGKRKGPKPRVDADDDGGEDGATPAQKGQAQYAGGRDKRKRKQQREYDDDDYIAGVKGGRGTDKRGMPLAAGAGGMVRSGSDMSLAAGDPRLAKRLKGQAGQKAEAGRMDAAGRMHPQHMGGRPGLARAPSAVLPHNWGYDDDALLSALVVEYGFNWAFIADTCSSTCSLQGVTRRSDWCKQRHSQVVKLGEAAGEAAAAQQQGLGPDGTPLDPAAAGSASITNLANLSKHQAKELIMRSLPVPEGVLKRHADAITPVFTKKKAQMMQDREGVRKQNAALAEPHVSHFKLAQSALGASGGRILSPLEITALEEEAKAAALAAEKERQRAAQQQQQAAAAAAAAAAQQQQAAAAAAAQQQQQQQQAAAQQQQMSGGAAAAGGATASIGSQGQAAMLAGTAQQAQALSAAQQQAAIAAAAGQQRPGTPGNPAAGVRPGGQQQQQLTEQQKQMLLLQQQQQQQAAALAVQQQRAAAGQAASAGMPPQQAMSPGTQQQAQQQALLAQQQQYAQQQAQQQLMAQRMAGYQMQGGAAAGPQGMAMNPALAAQMAQAQKAGAPQLQQMAVAPGSMGMPAVQVAGQQMQLAGLNQQQLAQMQLLQPMGGGAVPGAGGVHPAGMPGGQGMMWPMAGAGPAGMPQANLAYMMQQQQQGVGMPGAGQPPASQPPS